MTVGIAVPTTVASSAPRLIPRRRPAVMARRRATPIGAAECESATRSGYHADSALVAQERLSRLERYRFRRPAEAAR